jgi:hypothetical protein
VAVMKYNQHRPSLLQTVSEALILHLWMVLCYQKTYRGRRAITKCTDDHYSPLHGA